MRLSSDDGRTILHRYFCQTLNAVHQWYDHHGFSIKLLQSDCKATRVIPTLWWKIDVVEIGVCWPPVSIQWLVALRKSTGSRDLQSPMLCFEHKFAHRQGMVTQGGSTPQVREKLSWQMMQRPYRSLSAKSFASLNQQRMLRPIHCFLPVHQPR